MRHKALKSAAVTHTLLVTLYFQDHNPLLSYRQVYYSVAISTNSTVVLKIGIGWPPRLKGSQVCRIRMLLFILVTRFNIHHTNVHLSCTFVAFPAIMNVLIMRQLLTSFLLLYILHRLLLRGKMPLFSSYVRQ